jgi:hypothetical protein
VGNSEEILYKTKLDRLRKLHSSFLGQGMMTFEIVEEVDPFTQKVHMPSDITLKDSIKPEKMLYIYIK